MFLFWDSISSDVTNSFKWVYFMWIQTKYASDIYLYTAVYIENHYKWSNVFTIKQINLIHPQWIRLSNTIAATPFLVCIPVPHTSISLTTLHWLSSKISLLLCVLKISSTWYPAFSYFLRSHRFHNCGTFLQIWIIMYASKFQLILQWSRLLVSYIF